MDTSKKTVKPSPYEKANPLSKLLLWWLGDIFKKGMKTDLTADDIYDPLKGDLSEPLGDELEKNWTKEVLDAKTHNRKPRLMRAIRKTFFWSYMWWGFLECFQCVILRNIQPFALAYLISYFNPKEEYTVSEGYMYGVALNVIALVAMLLSHHCSFGELRIGMRLRVACCSLVYRKILRLNRLSLGKTATGQIVNLMSNDVNRFDFAAVFFHNLWIMPLQIPLAAYLMYESVQVSAFIGIAVLVLQALILQGWLSRLQTLMRKKIAVRTDERVKLMSEIVAGIQVIKMYAWEKPFNELVAMTRRIEMKLIGRTNYIRGVSLALMVFMERVALYATIVAFVLAGNVLRGDIVFSIAQYYNQLQLTVSILFPLALASFGEAKISVKRLEEFMMLEEKVTWAKMIPHNGGEKKLLDQKTDIVVTKVRAAWTQDAIVDTLRDLCIRIRPGQFCAVVGPVGSGKSSLLQLLLGELPLNEGTMDLGGAQVSYSSQEPWLFVATVRNNILFGQPFDKDKYRKVVKACSLEKDFDQFPKGDQTMVGERGVSLSGGQRARINLARAVYRDADLYMMDDPLSAVDSHVGKHLVNECLLGYLATKTRILVTHQLHHLRAADLIVILRNGQVEVQGTYDEVCKNVLFSELMSGGDEDASPDSLIKENSIVDTEEKENVKNEEDKDETKEEKENVKNETKEGVDVIPGDEDEDEDADENQELMEKGNLSKSVYSKYLSAGGGWFILSTTAFLILMSQVITSLGDLYLTAWSNNEEYIKSLNSSDYDLVDSSMPLPATSSPTVDPPNVTAPFTIMGTSIDTANMFLNLTRLEEETFHDTNTAVYVYTALIVACIILTTARSLMFFWVCVRASINLHNTMFSNILEATMRFFDTNPSGRVLNRFSKDMGAVDEMLPRYGLEAIQIFMVGLGILVMVAIKSPYMLIAMAVIGLVLYKMTVIYLQTAQDVKRLEGVTRSPVFSHLSATLNGLSTIRAFGAQEMVKREFDHHQDMHSGAWYITLATNTAFGLWLSNFCCLFVCVVSFTFLFIGKDRVYAGDVGLALSQSLIMTGMLQHGIKQFTMVVTQMTSVERVLQYTKLPKETGLNGPNAPSGWPNKGRLEFKGTYMRYDTSLEPVLKDLNVTVESGWKVGIVGRTGAGKSSLISALFRLAVVEGEIIIDNKDTKDIKLHDIRSKISIIPQEPMLFSASLRHNLDPFNQQSDASLWGALEDVELKEVIGSLSQLVSEGGRNFSAGQRQLLCLARAIVKNNILLVLDEATANVDPKTDSLIQKTIRNKFKHCTVLTIAHRLNTVMDSDRILVMDHGRMVEYDHPHLLLNDSSTILSQMVAQLGAATEKNLRDVAREAYEKYIKFIDEPTAID